MKLITLNIWGARVRDPFLEFINNRQDVDVFCFQEVYDKAEEKMSAHYPNASHNIFTELQALLPAHTGFFRPALEGVYGLATFVKKEIPILEGRGGVLIHENANHPKMSGHHSRNLQWVNIRPDSQGLTVINVHGLWNGMGKTDTPDRIAQSERIKGFVDSIAGPKILCGDFNLRPDTESIQILEIGMRNLIKEYDVKSTRTSIYKKEERFADYVFISPEIMVKDFRVLPDEVSDHSALLLEI